MNGRVTIRGRKSLAILHLVIGCLFLPFGVAALMLSAAGLSQGQWLAGAFCGVFAVPAFLLILGHILVAYRAINPDLPILLMSDTEFYDARIMSDPILWHRLRFETDAKTGLTYMTPMGGYKAHIHRRWPDRMRHLVDRLAGAKGYAVRAEWTGLTKEQLAHELVYYTTPVGNFRNNPNRMPRRSVF